MTTRNGGFTLIELMVVTVVIAILVAVVLPRFVGTREKAHRSQMETDLNSLVSAMEDYFADSLEYPTTMSNLDFNASQGVNLEITDTRVDGWAAKATHGATSTVCGVYIGSATAPAGVQLSSDGVIGCNSS